MEQIAFLVMEEVTNHISNASRTIRIDVKGDRDNDISVHVNKFIWTGEETLRSNTKHTLKVVALAIHDQIVDNNSADEEYHGLESLKE